MVIDKIAHIRTDFPTKFGLPRQSGIVSDLCGVIEFESEYKNPDALRGLSGYSHIWLIWGFSINFASRSTESGLDCRQNEKQTDQNHDWNATVRPPRLGGNKRVGVFATRSPNRPNPIGLSVVKIEKIEDCKIYVSGIDMADGTPIYDIKPYLPNVDKIDGALGGFASSVDGERLSVVFPDELKRIIPDDKCGGLIACLKNDPRPSYKSVGFDEREYGFEFAGFEIKFTVSGDVLTVTDVIL